MCSGNGTNFENIVRTCTDQEVVLMIYNKKHCGARKRSEKLGIPCCHIKSGNEEDIIKLFKAWRVDLIAVEQALDSGDEVSGCTVHYVTEELDSGEIIYQSEVPIFEGDTVDSLTKRIQREEYSILPLVIKEKVNVNRQVSRL